MCSPCNGQPSPAQADYWEIGDPLKSSDNISIDFASGKKGEEWVVQKRNRIPEQSQGVNIGLSHDHQKELSAFNAFPF